MSTTTTTTSTTTATVTLAVVVAVVAVAAAVAIQVPLLLVVVGIFRGDRSLGAVLGIGCGVRELQFTSDIWIPGPPKPGEGTDRRLPYRSITILTVLWKFSE